MTQAIGPDPALSIWRADPAASILVDKTLGQVLSEAAVLWPDSEALVYAHQPGIPEVRWSYAELDRRARRLAAGLCAAGYRPGEAVAIWAPNQPEWILLEYAAAKAGLIVVALNPLYKSAELGFALRTASAVGIFHAEAAGGVALRSIVDAVAPEVPTLRGIHALSDGVAEMLAAGDGAGADASVDPESVFMIQYTSGTTGVPKAAQLAHRGTLTSAMNIHRRWELGPGSRVCHGFPQFHVGGSGCMTPGAALVGATSLPLHIFKAPVALDVLERERCSCFIGVPTQLFAMLEDPSFPRRDLSALRLIVVGGAPVPVELLKRCESAFGVNIVNSYGMTETGGVSASQYKTDTAERKAHTVGIAMPGVSFRIADSDNRAVAHGVPGELCYQGPGLMRGYLNAEAGADGIDAEGWFHTGDRASMDASGYLRIVGRVKEMIIRGGENLSPLEIENQLLQHSSVMEAAVVGLPDHKYGEEICAVIRPHAGADATPEDVRDWCAQRISRWKVPRYVAFVDELPYTPSGKVRKFLLRERMIEHFGLSP